jgi:hypothetical protein
MLVLLIVLVVAGAIVFLPSPLLLRIKKYRKALAEISSSPGSKRMLSFSMCFGKRLVFDVGEFLAYCDYSGVTTDGVETCVHLGFVCPFQTTNARLVPGNKGRSGFVSNPMFQNQADAVVMDEFAAIGDIGRKFVTDFSRLTASVVAAFEVRDGLMLILFKIPKKDSLAVLDYVRLAGDIKRALYLRLDMTP